MRVHRKKLLQEEVGVAAGTAHSTRNNNNNRNKNYFKAKYIFLFQSKRATTSEKCWSCAGRRFVIDSVLLLQLRSLFQLQQLPPAQSQSRRPPPVRLCYRLQELASGSASLQAGPSYRTLLLCGWSQFVNLLSRLVHLIRCVLLVFCGSELEIPVVISPGPSQELHPATLWCYLCESLQSILSMDHWPAGHWPVTSLYVHVR